jgi:hypothetical protein
MWRWHWQQRRARRLCDVWSRNAPRPRRQKLDHDFRGEDRQEIEVQVFDKGVKPVVIAEMRVDPQCYGVGDDAQQDERLKQL